jgi:hypothetical protein
VARAWCGRGLPAPSVGFAEIGKDIPSDTKEALVVTISKAAKFRQTVAGLCLLLAPLLFAAAELLGPDAPGDPAAQLAAYAEHRASLLASALLSIASSIVFIPALFGLLHRVRGRGVVYGHVALALMLYGLLTAHAALAGINIMFWEMAKPGMDRSAMTSLLDGLQHEPVGAPLLLGHYLFAIGYLLLGVALLRANAFPRWAAVCVILAPASDILAGFTPVDSLVGDIVSSTFAIVGFAAIGVKVLFSPDATGDEAALIPTVPATQPVQV